MKTIEVYIEGINPIPWKAPLVGKRWTKPDENFTAYKQALREIIAEKLPAEFIPFTESPLRAHYWFWRDLDEGANRADVTNLVKATEDALQTYNWGGQSFVGLYKNDRLIVDSHGTIVQQAKGIEPRVFLVVEQMDSQEWIDRKTIISAAVKGYRTDWAEVRIDSSRPLLAT